MPVDDSTLAPTFEIEVDNNSVGEAIKRLTHHVEYDSSDGLADMGKIKLSKE